MGFFNLSHCWKIEIKCQSYYRVRDENNAEKKKQNPVCYNLNKTRMSEQHFRVFRAIYQTQQEL